ncbi:AI-2E family transporter [Roseococcus pinisoli]|uniref:AI-2E family transporter n=1 Tax=Roseococcus pinisoli TaxID=2835040 RepID=A0ABS5QHP2_9PROT|nr:AI-2E family transporter [Roseococcus pinisoli]MBS7813192.1 AI-2E family transporter [Roseococcus pinisoli]
MNEPVPAPGRGRLAPLVATRRQRLMLSLGALGTVIGGLWLFSEILTPFVLAGCIAYFLDPLATRMTRMGLPRGLAAILLVFLLVLLTLLSLLLLYPLIVSQMAMLLNALPSYVSSITATLRDLLVSLEEAAGPDLVGSRLRELIISQASAMVSWLGTAATRLIGGGFALFNVFTLAIVTPVMSFYLLRDWPGMMARLESWMPRRSASTLRQLARDIDRVLSAWLRGQLLCCLILGVYYAVTLSAIGLELGLTVGLVSGFLSFIPYVGSMTGLALSVLLAIGQWGDWNGVLWVLAIFFTGQAVEGYVIYPRLMGDRVHLHAVWVIFALFAGGVAFGFLGVLLAVPMAAAIGVLARYWLRRYLESPLYLDPPRTGL